MKDNDPLTVTCLTPLDQY